MGTFYRSRGHSTAWQSLNRVDEEMGLIGLMGLMGLISLRGPISPMLPLGKRELLTCG